MSQESRIIQLVQNLNNRIKHAENERDLIMRMITQMQTQDLDIDNSKCSDHESCQLLNEISHSSNKNIPHQKSDEEFDYNNKGFPCKLKGPFEETYSESTRLNASKASKQPKWLRNSKFINHPMEYNVMRPYKEDYIKIVNKSCPKHVDAACYFRLNNLIRKLQSLTDYCHKPLQTFSNSGIHSIQPDMPTWTYVPQVLPSGCTCASSSPHNGFVLRNSNQNIVDITQCAVKDVNSCKTSLGNPVSMSPLNSDCQISQAVHVVTTVKPCQNAIDANKSMSSTKYCRGRCHCRENQRKNVSPAIYTVIEYSTPMKKVAWR
ncbi:hypothetical protein EWB00_002735 [Schistosoma japonicum]|uniref:Uncharacterized protein n=2 Tax=Schistosoma japonicum TaxID=6182 RepID=A0A4Z2DAW7_SCHJA|nr:hypothetical protein EWB00_002735 [Schistosoma japonicum]